MRLAVQINPDGDNVWIATNWAVFYVALPISGRQINRDDNFFATAVANIAGFIVHGLRRGVDDELFGCGYWRS